MRDEKEGKKEASKEQGKATQHTQGSHFSKKKNEGFVYVNLYSHLR